MICCAILSGGYSKRFRDNSQRVDDKALYKIDDKPMILHIYEKLLDLCGSSGEIIISLRSDQLNKYRSTLFIDEKVTFAIDLDDGRGPLVGIYSALRHCPYNDILIVPNDAPFIPTDLLRELLGRLGEGYHIVSPMLENSYIESLVSALNKEIVYPILEILVKKYNRSRMTDLYRGTPNIYLYNTRRHGFDYRYLINVNTEKDLVNPQKPRVLIEEDISITREFSITDIHLGSLEKLRKSIWYTLFTKSICEEYLYYIRKKIYYLALQILRENNILSDKDRETEIFLEELFWERTN